MPGASRAVAERRRGADAALFPVALQSCAKGFERQTLHNTSRAFEFAIATSIRALGRIARLWENALAARATARQRIRLLRGGTVRHHSLRFFATHVDFA
jgi:hypothetical protein